MRVPFDTVADTIEAAFRRAGMAPDKARICARIHAESSRDGVASHGLNRVPRFVDYLQRGWVDAGAEPALARRVGPIEIWDGRRGPGVLNALAATDRALAIAAEQGCGIVALRNTTHWMRGGAYGWRAAEAGKILIAWTNTESVMPAWGGTDARIGNNPLVIALPGTPDHAPLVLDMAMSQYSYGKLEVTRQQGRQLPYPGGFDSAGELTTDPAAIEATRRILPTGLWKGAGLSIVLDVLAAALSEGLATDGIDKVGEGSCTGCSQIYMGFDPETLGSADHLRETLAGMARHLASSTPAEAGRGVTYPGQNTRRMRAENLQDGVPVDEKVWAEVQALA
ncbi:3-dehydro-L-gulonate 2-dehydrogenase [Paracoccus zhejiangensis]|uniref:3-dehydro-L-gulonate 2-dehydrogenase n=1 Tax=Paracoccus zhejiangensis TaxID=1077935 RepID=A0A2H5F097_9RHOB|nr:3-dehydro-L-gulonate 2-dehydrogenase [Paracoccus zhejiangensis]AUH64967.1 3-dehydro-L-gulonate 2-dehydrogenase [Paracoccus zhejiangensis]